ncbi:hypothetical protein BON30_18815 [Cystobacter ferrugineus]|uniref:Peptidase C58 YopT-type domain-containing protein n=2 Tax=Cystobacter ferrugineus TaxID=83449 RepID=A0A1L9BBF5_9BACT|nr:hypothetical protein BON30_18815 [Cystobacter ferrugineus]
MPRALNSTSSSTPASSANSTQSSAATGSAGATAEAKVQEQKPPASSPPGYHKDQLGKPNATPQDTSANAVFQSKKDVAALNSRRNSVFTSRPAQGNPGSAASRELAPQAGALQGGHKKAYPQPEFLTLAAQNGAHIDAWVDQANNESVQNSPHAAGVCNAMVNEWTRAGVNGTDAAFSAVLQTGQYHQFVKLQEKATQVQHQVIKNENFILDNSAHNMGFGDQFMLQVQNSAHDQNNAVPNLNTQRLTPQNAGITTNANLAGQLSTLLQQNMPPAGSTANFKMRIVDTNGAGHAIGIKTHHLPNGQVEHSMLDPNTGEFTKIPQQNFTQFVTDHMNLMYGNDYQNGRWALNHVTP